MIEFAITMLLTLHGAASNPCPATYSSNAPQQIYNTIKFLVGHSGNLSFLLITVKSEKTLFSHIHLNQWPAWRWLHFILIFLSYPPTLCTERFTADHVKLRGSDEGLSYRSTFRPYNSSNDPADRENRTLFHLCEHKRCQKGIYTCPNHPKHMH